MAKRESRRQVSDAEIAAARAVLMAAEENERAEKRARQRASSQRGCLIALAIVAILIVASALGDGNRKSQQTQQVADLPTLAALPSETPLPSGTAPPTATLSDSEMDGTRSAAYVATSFVELTMMAQPREIPEVTEPPRDVPAASGGNLPFDEVQYVSLVEEAYAGSANRPAQVLAANGRGNGGEIVLIISYASRAVSEGDILREAAMMLIPVADAIAQRGLDVDSIVLSIGDPRGQALGVAGVSAADLMAYRAGENPLTTFVEDIDYTSLVDLESDATPVPTLPPAMPSTLPPAMPSTLPPAMPSTLPPAMSTQVQQGSMYVCNGMNDLNCDDFPAGSGAATRHLQQCGDEDALDRDGDGLACEDR